MTTAALILSVLALLTAVLALYLAVRAYGTAQGVQGALARHRQSHADRTEERRTARHHPAPPGTPGTEEMPAVSPPLPRPGRIGTSVTPAPLSSPEDTW